MFLSARNCRIRNTHSSVTFQTYQTLWWSYLPNPSAREGYDTRSIFKRSLTGLNSEFSFSSTSCLTKAEELSLSYYLPIAGGRIIGFIPFPRVLVLCEMQSASFRIWTRIAVSISYDNNYYITGTFGNNLPNTVSFHVQLTFDFCNSQRRSLHTIYLICSMLNPVLLVEGLPLPGSSLFSSHPFLNLLCLLKTRRRDIHLLKHFKWLWWSFQETEQKFQIYLFLSDHNWTTPKEV